MVDPARIRVIERAAKFAPYILTSCNEIDPWIILGLICQESAGDPTAVRVEPGFWRRYGANVLKAIKASVTKVDDKWAAYPDLVSASYGACQVMYPVALEVGMELLYPTSLCDPAMGIEAGCRVLRRCYAQAGARFRVDSAVTKAALLRYNGGGDPQYADRVLGWMRDALQVVPTLFPTTQPPKGQ